MNYEKPHLEVITALMFINCTGFYLKVFTAAEASLGVDRLPMMATASAPKIARLTCGSVEEFRHDTGLSLSQGDGGPTNPTIGLHCSVKNNALYQFEFVLGGGFLDIEFKMSMFLGKEQKNAGSPDTVISVKEDLAGVKFRHNSHVSDWEPLQDRFRTSLSHPGAIIAWAEGPPVYCR